MKLWTFKNIGIEIKRADIVIYDSSRPDTPYIIVELKKPKLKEGKEQLKSYCNATGVNTDTYEETDFTLTLSDAKSWENLNAYSRATQ